MSATVISLAHEAESRQWNAVLEGDRLMATDYLQRARGIAAAWSAARAAGREEFVSCEVAAALCVDERTAQLLVAEARLLTELPSLGDAMADGRLRLPHAKVLFNELMPVATAIAVDVLSVVLAKVGERTPEQVRGIVRRAIIRVDADAAARRRREAVRDRRVFTRAEPDGMALFGSYLAAADALEAYSLVDSRARADAADERTQDQRRADALMDLLRGSGSTGVGPTRRNVDVLVPVTVALGFSDEPAELCGYGPIDAEHARELLSDAVLRKVCVDAATGEVLAVETQTVRFRDPAGVRRSLLQMVLTPTPYEDDTIDGYRPSAAQRRTVERRDRTCTFPSCTAPAHRCDLDHRVPWPRGSTSAHNLGAASRKHHRAKQAGWSPGPGPAGSTIWNSPCGRTYTRPNAHEPPEPPDYF
jgi:hypothetical protein